MLQPNEENNVVKQALKEAGILFRSITHSQTLWYELIIDLDFTAWHHLEHKRLPTFVPNTFIPGRPNCFEDCKACAAKKELKEKAVRIAQEVTGRDERMKEWIRVRFLWCDTSENPERWKYMWD